ncbi:hypothetical protein AJ80_09974 [Polytolypa hystricis UAMH7299]|uniref:Uncharacterized protein n=1 Tax=Polytolypa hystricis (strain UAMH7299) TaxID=1447883 RepID=A0A2B7WFL5_POLH7|nr:hypothetical protein AJ80_09974 [Polytolypa hystricis UAMH7299]
MSRTVESPARREVREALRKIALCIKGLGVDEFNLQQLKNLDGPTYPHVKAVMYNNLVATDSTILCGELLPIFRIMLT